VRENGGLGAQRGGLYCCQMLARQAQSYNTSKYLSLTGAVISWTMRLYESASYGWM